MKRFETTVVRATGGVEPLVIVIPGNGNPPYVLFRKKTYEFDRVARAIRTLQKHYARVAKSKAR